MAAARKTAENPPEQPAEQTPLTKAEAAALVKREVPELKDGEPTGKTLQQDIGEAEVFAFREYDDHVIVVTVDGQKFRGDK